MMWLGQTVHARQLLSMCARLCSYIRAKCAQLIALLYARLCTHQTSGTCGHGRGRRTRIGRLPTHASTSARASAPTAACEVFMHTYARALAAVQASSMRACVVACMHCARTHTTACECVV